ncbi:MAG: hypothetical protein WBN22_01065 [Verrucomicrobiia bacterium]
MHCLPDIFLLKWLLWFPVLGLWSNSGGNSSNPQTTTETATSSAASSPNATGGSQAIGSGSIGVAGTGASYIESGAQQVSGISGGNGSTITIGDPNASDALAQIAEQLAGGGSSGGSGSIIVPAGGGASSLFSNVNWTVVAIVGAIVLGLWLILGRKEK